MRTRSFKDSGWDIYDSTYIQKIYLSNGMQFFGYSKKNNFSEKNDKQALLINWIVRMHKSGYLDENYHDTRRTIDFIEYYVNHYPHKKLILRLRYHYYECLDEVWSLKNRNVIKFLDEFYSALNSRDNQKIKSLYIHKKTRVEDPFDMSIRRFITKKSLLDYCHRMQEEKKFTQEQAMAFFNKYSEVYPFDKI